MLRSAIDWHSTSLKMLLEVSMLVIPDVPRRISRRWASRPGKNLPCLGSAACCSDTDTNSEETCLRLRARNARSPSWSASRVGARIEMQRGGTRLAVETLVVEHDIGGTDQFRGTDAAAPPVSPRTSNRSAKSLSNDSVRSKRHGGRHGSAGRCADRRCRATGRRCARCAACPSATPAVPGDRCRDW